MTTLAIVGAGPGLGAAVARRFGAEGFAVAVISRQPGPRRRPRGRSGRGRGDRPRLRRQRPRPDALTGALDQAADDLGPVEVLQYSPVPQAEFMHPVLDTTRRRPHRCDRVLRLRPPHRRPPRPARACGPWAAGPCCSSTAAAAPDRTRRSPAPPSPSPAKAPTRPCCTPPWPRRTSTSAS